jgi:hypothetical protein
MKRAVRLVMTVFVFVLSCNAVVPRNNRIDDLVFDRLAKNGFQPSELCPDDVFIRRVFLDVIGTHPTETEVREYFASPDTDKRRLLIDYLLERNEFADYQVLKWCDLLRVKSEFPANLWPNAVQAYAAWVRDAVRSNMPYDRFARALLTASGSNFRDPPVNFYRPFQQRTPRNFLDTTALLFMGVRLENSGWSEEQLLGMDAFFAGVSFKATAEWKEEIVYFDPAKKLLNPATGQPVLPAPVDGGPLTLNLDTDLRAAFADWLTAPDNPWFARAIVNRIWFWLTGRGIVHEADDIRPDNPAWSPELLDYLSRELVENHYDLKHIYRLILNSSAYQLSSVPTPENSADETGFSHYRVRRLDAEVLIDAIDQITGSGEEYSSAIPEPFTFVPATQRTITLADGSIKSPFLELFGRPGRDSSFESDRNNNPSVFQSLHMLNSSHIQQKIMQSSRLRRMLRELPSGRAQVEWLYLEILSRYPSGGEMDTALSYINAAPGADGFYDLTWALINSSEFILKH